MSAAAAAAAAAAAGRPLAAALRDMTCISVSAAAL